MAKTISTVCMGYLICNMPIILYKFLMRGNYNPYILLVFSTLYWIQCSFNFIIYASTNKQYKEAFVLFITMAVCRMNKASTTSANSPGNHLAAVDSSQRLAGNTSREESYQYQMSRLPRGKNANKEKRVLFTSDSCIPTNPQSCPAAISEGRRKKRSTKVPSYAVTE